MNKTNCFLILISFLLFSCGKTKQSELLEIPVDFDQNISLPLSEIVDELIIIDPELTDESLINPDRIRRVFLSENYVIIGEIGQILVFNKDGKFAHPIGSRGQGPEEYSGLIRSLALDEKNGRLFVNTTSELLCYDLDGNFIRKARTEPGTVIDINYVNDKLLLVAEQSGGKDEKGRFIHSVVYRMNDELQITDSCTIRNTYFERPFRTIHPYEYYILPGNSSVFLYHPDIYPNESNPAETVLRDTLYRFENNQLVPELKLKFKNNGIGGYGNKIIQLFTMYRSSRYVFAVYGNDVDNIFNYNYRFCFDTKTGKGYNIQDGYTDYFNNIEKRVSIRPLSTNPDMFCYWHTHMNPDDLEEPNPTIYIGTLKK